MKTFPLSCIAQNVVEINNNKSIQFYQVIFINLLKSLKNPFDNDTSLLLFKSNTLATVTGISNQYKNMKVTTNDRFL